MKNAMRKRGICLADGGVASDPVEDLLKRMSQQYGAPSAGPAKPAPQNPIAQPPKPAQQQAEPIQQNGSGITNLMRDRGKAIDKASGYKDGALIGISAIPSDKGIAPFGPRHDSLGVKGNGWFGLIPAKGGASSEISMSDDKGDFPTMVPTLNKSELDHLLAGNDPTPEIVQKARSWADHRRRQGLSPFADGQGVKAPIPGNDGNYAVGAMMTKGEGIAGGIVSGKGTPTSDDVPVTINGKDANLSTTESVLPSKTTQALGEMLGAEPGNREQANELVRQFIRETNGKEPADIKAGAKLAVGAVGEEEDKNALAKPSYMRTFNPATDSPDNVGKAMAANGPARSISDGLNYINRGDPVKDAANAVGGFFSRSAQMARGDVEQVQPANPIAAPVVQRPAVATPAVDPSAVQRIANANESDLAGRQGAFMATNNVRELRDVGGGIASITGADGRKTITNVGTAGITDPAKGIVNGSASALIDQKNSTYNPAQQLENMQRLRLTSDLTNPEIRDESVRANAAKALAQMGSKTENDMRRAQIGGIAAQTAVSKMMADLQQKAIGGDQNALATLRKLNGKDADKFLVVPGGEYTDPTNPMNKLKEPSKVFDANNRQFVSSEQQAKQTFTKADVDSALAKGADKTKLAERIKSLGGDPKDYGL